MIMTESPSPTIERLPDDFIQHPFELFARLRSQGPAREIVMPHGVKVWMVTRYDEVRTLLTDPGVSKDGRRMNEMFARHSVTPSAAADGDEPAGPGFDDNLSAHMMNSDPPRHTRLRTLVSKAFTARRMADLRPRIEQITGELLDAMAGASRLTWSDPSPSHCPSPSSSTCSASRRPTGPRSRNGPPSSSARATIRTRSPRRRASSSSMPISSSTTSGPIQTMPWSARWSG